MQKERTRPYPSENRKLTEKTCRDCGKLLPISKFGWNGRGDWLPRCKKCDTIRLREYRRRRANKMREWLDGIKMESGCLCCGEMEPRALVFHHRNSDKKLFSISNGISRSKKLLLSEIAKCDVMCFNCHAKAHAGVIPFPSRKKDIDAV